MTIREWLTHPHTRGFLIVFCVSFLYLYTLEQVLAPFNVDQVHFQAWSSDDMQQLLPIKELQHNPIKSLWYLHKTPPAIDVIRAVVSQFFPSDLSQLELVSAVDKNLYLIWNLFYSLMCGLVFAWVSSLVSSRAGYLAAFIWTLHPACLAYATLLETTFLSSLALLLFYYSLWRIRTERSSRVGSLIFSTALLFYTRAFYQWYFIPIVILSLILMRVPRRKVIRYLLGVVILIGPYVIKQKILFNTFDTFSVAGYHYCGVLWHRPSPAEREATRIKLDLKFDIGNFESQDYFNSKKQSEDNIVYKTICLNFLREQPLDALRGIIKSFKQNFEQGLRPSSRYSPNTLVDSLPYREFFDWLFSGKMLLGALVLSLLTYFVYTSERASHIHNIGFALPFLYTTMFILLGNRYKWVESERLKFIIEPLLFIFVFFQIMQLLKRGWRFIRTIVVRDTNKLNVDTKSE